MVGPKHRKPILAVVLAVGLSMSAAAFADSLFVLGQTQSLATDRRAAQTGDIVTVVIVQAAEASTTVRSGSRRSTSLSGGIDAGSIHEKGDISLGNNFDGQGQASRTERFVTQMTAKVIQVLPNGDLEITGTQRLNINGEATTVAVRGIIRSDDIDSDNRVASNRIADAQIDYTGKGFATRGSKPGLLQKIFTLFGLL